jgi:hypothetical protein
MNDTIENTLLLQKITDFINSINIPCNEGVVRGDSFLPGVDIVNGSIVYDLSVLLSPGDLLHEAGHISVLKPEDRMNITSPDVNGDLQEGGAEMAAIAWSWAALQHLQIPPEVVFHEQGYKDGGDALIENFSNERYLGVSLLQWFGMTKEKKSTNTDNDTIYPKMKYWLRS